MITLERSRLRRRAWRLAGWAAVRAVACGVVGYLSGEYAIAFVAWAALTIFHVERCNDAR